MIAAGSYRATGRALVWFCQQARPRRTRTIREFAEAEIVIPDGPFEGRRFRIDRQPSAGLWFDEIDSGRWRRHVATGPQQSGKSLSCFIIPALYHLFEVRETVICGLPDMDMAADKWREDLLPAIERSRYRDLLPLRGGGSRGGKVQTIQFRHGPTLKFMSGGGSDKRRAAFTSRVVVVTETDGLDEAGSKSREADKLTQIEGRTRAYGSRARIYLECTVSTETGRTWREYTEGSQSRIVLPCPHCRGWVTPERDSLIGWSGAESKNAAVAAATFSCPNCGEAWTEEQREAANLAGVLLHEGQTIDASGTIHGRPPATDTLGFRWTATNNLLVPAGVVGGDEWRAARALDEDLAEREMRQFVWALPSAPNKETSHQASAHDITHRVDSWPRGICPESAELVTAAMDLGKWLGHWVVVAFSPGATPHVVDYGRTEVATADLGIESAILQACREFGELIATGWPVGKADNNRRLVPAEVWIDAGYETETVYKFCRQAGEPFRPSMGQAASQRPARFRSGPSKTGSRIRFIGEGYHFARMPQHQVTLAEVDADHWKTWVANRLATPMGQPGALTLFRSPPNDHLAFAKHLTAEVKVEEFIPNRGLVTRWEQKRKNNHWLDALYNACAAGHRCGSRLLDDKPPAPARRMSLRELRDQAKAKRKG